MLLALALPSGPALAHARLAGTEPVADAVLDTPPAAVRLRFDESVAPAVLRWLLPDGRSGDAVVLAEGADLVLAPPPEAGRGTYLLSWRVTSSDGHPVAGALAFSIGAASGTPEMPQAGGTALAAAGSRLLAWAALILGCGAALSGAAIGPLTPSARRTGRAAAALSIPLGALALGLHGLDLTGEGPHFLLQAAPWTLALTSPPGSAALLRLGAALLALGALATGNRAAAIAGAGLAGLALGAAGHTRAGLPAEAGFLLAGLHGFAVVFWLGGLPPLLTGLAAEDALPRLRRFSAMALPVVLLLMASGSAMALVVAPASLDSLSAPWAGLLAAKLALVAAMLALALRNRVLLTPALAAGVPGTAARLVRSIGAEIGLGCAVLLLAAGFRLTGPPPGEVPPLTLHVHGAAAMADVEIAPARPGPVAIRLHLASPEFERLEAREVTLVLSDPARGLGPIRAGAVPQADGSWLVDSVPLPAAGAWRLKLDILVSAFSRVTLEEGFTLGEVPQ